MNEERLLELKNYFISYPDTPYLPNMFSEVIQALERTQQELTKYKERNETLLDIIRYYKTTEWGLKSCEILDNFEEILEDKEKKC